MCLCLTYDIRKCVADKIGLQNVTCKQGLREEIYAEQNKAKILKYKGLKNSLKVKQHIFTKNSKKILKMPIFVKFSRQ